MTIPRKKRIRLKATKIFSSDEAIPKDGYYFFESQAQELIRQIAIHYIDYLFASSPGNCAHYDTAHRGLKHAFAKVGVKSHKKTQ